MKITMNKKHLLLVFVLCLIGGLFCACHKEEIKEPVDYRDKWVGEYFCPFNRHGAAFPTTIKIVKVKSLDSALYFYCYGDFNTKFISNVDIYGNFFYTANYYGKFFAEDSIVLKQVYGKKIK